MCGGSTKVRERRDQASGGRRPGANKFEVWPKRSVVNVPLVNAEVGCASPHRGDIPADFKLVGGQTMSGDRVGLGVPGRHRQQIKKPQTAKSGVEEGPEKASQEKQMNNICPRSIYCVPMQRKLEQ